MGVGNTEYMYYHNSYSGSAPHDDGHTIIIHTNYNVHDILFLGFFALVATLLIPT
jgi:hypothetical protein